MDYQGQIHDNPKLLIERDSRKTLYETLPFIAAFGMSSTEGNALMLSCSPEHTHPIYTITQAILNE